MADQTHIKQGYTHKHDVGVQLALTTMNDKGKKTNTTIFVGLNNMSAHQSEAAVTKPHNRPLY